MLAKLNRWSARFDLRPGEVGEGEKIVIREVWDQDDYRAVGKPGLAGAVVVDIGANIGAFSVLAARAGARKVLAFEPDLSNYSRLNHHVALNRAATVETVNAAVTDGSAPYVRMVGLSDGAHAEPSDNPNDIPTITLADIIGRLGKVDFIKIDVEGNEFSIIEAVPLELLSRVKRMALEWHAPVVTHLMHLRGDEFGPLVTKLAEAGRVETFGHPSRGGLIWWRGYVQ
jgi:FkbM family methyltransferase